ncbi:MAG: heme-binding domain-containing protein [Cyclobacteriaceae bacterium]|jgi:hypothetical protein|nr:heme-binding domain-containing protein [Cyclobacteriaceae bacterium]
MKKKIVLALVAIVVIMQFIRPSLNQSEPIVAGDISKVMAVPQEVHALLINKCYDCHSNNTNYPWYAHVQPVGWFLNSHVVEGKEHLNFSVFATYDAKKAAHKLEEVGEAFAEGWMPLDSYTLIHKDAKVTPEDVVLISNWLSKNNTSAQHE